MYKILENIATDALGEPTEISSYVDCKIGLIDDFTIIDVRVLPDFDAPLSPSQYKLLGQKVVVCCGHGMNRILQNGFFQGIRVNKIKGADMHYHVCKHRS